MTTHIEEYRLIGDVKVPPMAIGMSLFPVVLTAGAIDGCWDGC
jgi:hypothetical protein